MSDPLSLLRTYNMEKKTIVEGNGYIKFGEDSWPKDTDTNYVMWGTGKDGTPKQYYTLECLLYLLKHIDLTHPVYVRQATLENMPVVRRPDRKELLEYLNGKIDNTVSIDKSAVLEMPKSIMTKDDLEIKKPRRTADDQTDKIKGQLQSGFDMNQDASVTIMNKIKSLSEAMSKEKIAAIKAKRLAIKNINANKLKTANIVDTKVDGESKGDLSQLIKTFEFVTRDRNSILDSSGKNFSNVLVLLRSIRNREAVKDKTSATPAESSNRTITPVDPRTCSYNRYDQERFVDPNSVVPGFKINTLGTYQGMPLGAKLSSPKREPTPVPAPLSGVGLRPELSTRWTRKSRTPIIIVPSAPRAVITMYNARELLEELRYVSSDDKKASGAAYQREIVIHQHREDGTSVPYRIIENRPDRLSPEEWERVVAVFVTGAAWQFKGWPWYNGGDPTGIFSRVCTVCLKMENVPVSKHILDWNIKVIEILMTKPHTHRASLKQFWETLKEYVVKHKPDLRV